MIYEVTFTRLVTMTKSYFVEVCGDYVPEKVIEKLSEEFYDTPDFSLTCKTQDGDHYVHPATSVPKGVTIYNDDE